MKKKVIKKEPAKQKSADGPYQTPKGMRDLLEQDYFAMAGFMERAAEVAIYYGFGPIETPILEQEEVFVRAVGEETDVVSKELYTLRTKGGDRLAMRPEYTAGIMRAYIEHGMQSLPQPVMLYSAGTLYRHDKPQKGRYREYRTFNAEIIGSEKSINDAIVIKVFMSVMAHVGLEGLTLSINSIGDKDCRPNYKKELVNYYRKNLSKVCVDCATRFRTNPMRLLDCKEPECLEIKKGAPDSVAYLCEPCKSHFKEVLEYLEALKIEYTIDPTLVRGLDYYTRTVFEVYKKQEMKEVTDKEGVTTQVAQPANLALGGGGRYDYLAKQLGANKNVPAVGFGMGVDRIIELLDKDTIAPRIVKKPKVFFIQLGPEAKLKSLSIIDVLREAKIPVAHSISKDSLGTQLSIAEKMGIPYCLIFGQREVIDNTVIVRDMSNRSQKSILLSDLSAYLKSMSSKK